jgi:hypothetical protein
MITRSSGDYFEIFDHQEIVGFPIVKLLPKFTGTDQRICGKTKDGLNIPLQVYISASALSIKFIPQLNGLVLVDKEGIIQSVENEFACSLFGTDSKTLIGQELQKYFASMHQVLESMTSIDFESMKIAVICTHKPTTYQVLHNDGHFIQVSVQCRRWSDEDGIEYSVFWFLFEKNSRIMSAPILPLHHSDVCKASPLAHTRRSSKRDDHSGLPKAIPYIHPESQSIPDSLKFASAPDDFEVVEDLGEGAYSFIKLSHYTPDPSKTPLVVKYVVRSKILSWSRKDGFGIPRIPVELAILKDLSDKPHPHILRLVSFFADDFYFGLVFEYKPAVDLFEFIERETHLEEDTIKAIMKQTLEAVRHIHQNGIVHRDIKDENILIDRDSYGKMEIHVTLIDFGSSAYIESGPFSTFFGTKIFCPPEILQGQEYHGIAQDMWSLGNLLYILTFRKNPYNSVDEILNLSTSFPDLLLGTLGSLIMALLQRNPADRLDSVGALNHCWFVN